MSLTTKPVLLAGNQTALENLKGPTRGDIQAEKARLRKATKEFESFFIYQMLKTMRQTVPENPLTKDSPMADGMGKETFTELFDMEVARRISIGGNSSIADLLYHSMEKLIEAEFHDENLKPEIKTLEPSRPSLLEIEKKQPLPLPPKSDEFHPVERPAAMLPLATSHRTVNEDKILADFGQYIYEASRETRLDSTLIASVIRAESGGDPRAVSRAGAKGLMQLADSTAQDMNVKDVFNPRENIRAGSRYLRLMLDRFGNLELALAAYNAGPGNVEKYKGVPPFAETRNYIDRVSRYLQGSVRH